MKVHEKLISKTFFFCLVCLIALLVGYVVSLHFPTGGIPLYGIFAGAVIAVAGIVAGRNLGGDAVKGDGIGSVTSRLFGKDKPPEAPNANP